jgi:hypothetical protein
MYLRRQERRQEQRRAARQAALMCPSPNSVRAPSHRPDPDRPQAADEPARKPKRDPFLPLHGDTLAEVCEPLCRLAGRDTSMRSMALRAAYIEISVLMAEAGSPIKLEGRDSIIAHRLRISDRAWRTLLRDLRVHGVLEETTAGAMTELARRELERRAKNRRGQRRDDGELPQPNGELPQPNGENSELASKINGRKSPLPLPLPLPLPATSPKTEYKTSTVGDSPPRARDGALPPALRDELERLVAEHVGDDRAAVILAELKRDRLRTEADVRDEAAWARVWLKNHYALHIAKGVSPMTQQKKEAAEQELAGEARRAS